VVGVGSANARCLNGKSEELVLGFKEDQKDGRWAVTSSIDVSSMLDEIKELDESGSFYFPVLQTTSFGRLLECLPIGCFLLDEKVRICFCNSYWAGGSQNSEDFLGKSFFSLIVGEERAKLIENRLLEVYETRAPMEVEAVLNALGKKLFGRLHVRSIRMGNARYLLVLFLDLTPQRKQLVLAENRKKELHKAQEQLKKRLEEKEVLLREIHHRVKNSLQLVSSLLALQGERAPDQRIAAALREAGNRIWSMALVHEALYRTSNLAEVSASDYMGRLLEHLQWSSGLDTNEVTIESRFDDFRLKTDTAINCGLIINELFSNCIKHAFPKGSGGSIALSLVKIPEDEIQLTVKDNGRGIAQEVALEDVSGYGLSVVKALVMEMKGTLKLKREDGSEFIIRLREE
jgi:two-component sensor histidine kinase